MPESYDGQIAQAVEFSVFAGKNKDDAGNINKKPGKRDPLDE